MNISEFALTDSQNKVVDVLVWIYIRNFIFVLVVLIAINGCPYFLCLFFRFFFLMGVFYIYSSSEMKPLDAIKTLGQGWIAEEALGIGLYAALKGANYTEVIQIAVNHSGDSDSTASITGQIYGAWKGAGEIPQEWTEALDVCEVLTQLSC